MAKAKITKESNVSKTKTLIIDNQEYDFDTLSNAARQQLVNLRVIDKEIERLKVQLGIAQIARASIAESVKSKLPAVEQK